jgi:hypothetical protein
MGTKEPKIYEVKFAYSGSGRREFFTQQFESLNIHKTISEYVADHNRGEAKSDRIRYWSKKGPLNIKK